MSDTAQIERLVEPAIAGLGFRLVRVSMGRGGRPTLQIMAEPLDGSPMTVEHCETVSRQVSALLDVHDPIKEAYQLEVSSPGIDRPLVTREDFARFAGFLAKLDLRDLCEGRKRLRGRITGPDTEDMITVREDSGAVKVPFGLVSRAKLVITDDLLAAAARPPGTPANSTAHPSAASHPAVTTD